MSTERPVHRMTLDGDNGQEQLYSCPEPGCGRRLVLNRGGRMVVLEQGDFFAEHSGGNIDFSSGLTISQ